MSGSSSFPCFFCVGCHRGAVALPSIAFATYPVKSLLIETFVSVRLMVFRRCCISLSFPCVFVSFLSSLSLSLLLFSEGQLDSTAGGAGTASDQKVQRAPDIQEKVSTAQHRIPQHIPHLILRQLIRDKEWNEFPLSFRSLSPSLRQCENFPCEKHFP